MAELCSVFVMAELGLAQRLPMRQVREVLRLKHAAGLSERHIAAALVSYAEKPIADGAGHTF